MINTQQTIRDYASAREAIQFKNEIGVEDYMQLKSDVFALIASVVLTGSGSPEGVATSNNSLLYVDVDVPTLYANTVVGVNTGWTAI